MSTGFIDKAMFVLTNDGFKTWASLSENNLVKSFSLGEERFSYPEALTDNCNLYNEKMIVVSNPSHLKKQGVLFSVSLSQRIFWIKDKSRSLQIGTALDFYEELVDVGTLYLVKDDNSLLLIKSSDAHIEPASSGWLVETKYGNMIVKADGPALKFCDCG